MTEAENLVLVHLRDLRNDLALFRTETRERLERVELRLSVIEQTLGNLYALSGSDRESLNSLTRRIDSIERRLELQD